MEHRSAVPRGAIILMAALVIAIESLHIAHRWARYDGYWKFIAVAFLVLLLLLPVRAFWGWGRKKLEWDQLFLVYTLVMLATSLFTAK